MQFKEFINVREEKFGSVVFDTLREKVFVTNETGKDVLCLLGEGHSEEKIVNTLAGSYRTQPEDIRDDVIKFVGHLKDNNIIL